MIEGSLINAETSPPASATGNPHAIGQAGEECRAVDPEWAAELPFEQVLARHPEILTEISLSKIQGSSNPTPLRHRLLGAFIIVIALILVLVPEWQYRKIFGYRHALQRTVLGIEPRSITSSYPSNLKADVIRINTAITAKNWSTAVEMAEKVLASENTFAIKPDSPTHAHLLEVVVAGQAMIAKVDLSRQRPQKFAKAVDYFKKYGGSQMQWGLPLEFACVWSEYEAADLEYYANSGAAEAILEHLSHLEASHGIELRQSTDILQQFLVIKAWSLWRVIGQLNIKDEPKVRRFNELGRVLAEWEKLAPDSVQMLKLQQERLNQVLATFWRPRYSPFGTRTTSIGSETFTLASTQTELTKLEQRLTQRGTP